MQNLLPDKIAKLAEKVVTENIAANRKITVAESCTGGLVSAAITEISGSSNVLGYGFVTYANDAKMSELAVDKLLLKKYGAVSTQVAGEMAKGALFKSGADIAVAISGIAGPDGGTAEKPVGTVMFAVATKNGVNPERKNFGTDLSRAEIRMAAAIYALELLLPA